MLKKDKVNIVSGLEKKQEEIKELIEVDNIDFYKREDCVLVHERIEYLIQRVLLDKDSESEIMVGINTLNILVNMLKEEIIGKSKNEKGNI